MLYAIDLFCGAGGFTLGFENAGIKCIGAFEIDRFACETFRFNFPYVKLFESDIRQMNNETISNLYKNDIDIISAGVPCQGFSVAGPSQYGIIDRRNSLILEVYRFANILKPSICIVENVKGILNGKISSEKKAIQEYISRMDSIGYTTKIIILQAADFGVPQNRERVFIISGKKESYIPGTFNREFGINGRPWRKVGDALFDLPLINSGEGTDDLIAYPKIDSHKLNDYQIWLRDNSYGVANHIAMKHTPRLIERFKHISIGNSLVDAPPEFGQRKRNGNELDVRNRFKTNNQRLSPEHPIQAITASFQSNFIHPYLHRNLTAREGARLQSFPDRFIFKGPRTLMSKRLLQREERYDEIGLSQYNQIGNAVPPLLAEGIGRAIKKVLNDYDEDNQANFLPASNDFN